MTRKEAIETIELWCELVKGEFCYIEEREGMEELLKGVLEWIKPQSTETTKE